jgi:hypothetical protein
MKKILSSLLLISATMMMFGQTLVSENFETLNTGNLGTDVTGATAGQNGWYSLYGTNSDYQIATIDATHGKSMTITSYNSYDASANSTLNTRIAAKLTTVTATPSNNILRGKFDLYTGASTGTGTIQMRVFGMNGSSSTTIGGFVFDLATKELRGFGTFTNLAPTPPAVVGPGVFTIGFAAAPGLLLTANTWATLEFRYNKTTGAMTWYWPGGSGGYSASTASLGLIPGMVGQDLYLYNNTAIGNTVSKIAGYDNILVEFANTGTLSANELSDKFATKSIKIYPNPTSDVLNIQTDSKINNISVSDMTGRRVNIKLDGDKVDVSTLPAGNYLINVETKDGISTEKFIKK